MIVSSMFKHKKKQQDQDMRRSPRTSASGRSPVFSYHSSRANPETSQAPRGSQQATGSNKSKSGLGKSRWVGYAPSIGALVVAIVGLFYMTTLTSAAKITFVGTNTDAAAIQDTEVYARAAQEELQHSIFNTSKLTINSDKIAQNLHNRFPELGKIIVTIPLVGRKPVIEIQPAIPALVMSSGNGTYIIDTEGRPVLKAADIASSVRDPLPVVTDESQASLEIGQQILPKDLVGFMMTLQQQLKVENISSESFILPPLANEVHVRLPGKGYIIKFNTEGDIRQQVGTYKAVIEKLTADGVTPAEYVDVRIAERAYYK